MALRIAPTLLIIMALLGFSNQASAEKESYIIGIVPQFEAKKLRKIWKPIIQELQQKTGLKFKLRGAPTIPAFEKEFLEGKFDLTYMNPFHLLIANEIQGYIPLVRDHSKKLQGILVVRNDSPVKSVQDLNNQTIAFPSPNALGASLQMRAELHDNFKIHITPKYVKTHDSVYLNVYLKQASAGGGVAKTFRQQPQKLQDQLRIIHKTTPVAPHPIAIHPRVPTEDRERILNALLDMSTSAHGKELLAQVPIKELGTASMDDYVPLEKMNLKRFFVSN